MAPPPRSGKPRIRCFCSVTVTLILTVFSFSWKQNCVLGNNCPYSGCQEAKRLHLHLKTCPANCAASKNETCHSNYNGCEQARQLLNHYRRCRGERARQVCRKEGQHCLICSLVARQAKSMLDRGKDKVGQSRLSGSMISVINKDMSLGDAAMMSGPAPSIQMPPPPPRRGILAHTSRIADASVLDARPNKSISFADSITRPRSSSVVENPTKEFFSKGRSRSLSVGSSPTHPCETILEEEGSSSTDQLEYPNSSML